MRKVGWLALLLPLLAQAGQAPAPVQLALHTAQGNQLLQLDRQQVLARTALPAQLDTPLGSLWKLFVYAYQVDRQLPDPGYVCTGQDRDEVYCCNPGERIDREQALAQSCGLYFAPAHLGLQAGEWQRYWQAQAAPAWLHDLDGLQPQRRVAVGELLEVLARLPAQAEARRVLLDVPLRAADGNVLGALGGRLRVKTWSWLADGDARARQGGFAGWLADGTPLWLGGPGTSQILLQGYAEALGQALPTAWPAEPGGCVEVELFARYPLRQVRRLDDGALAPAGALRGRYEVLFANGNRLPIESAGELFLHGGGDALQLTAQLPREDYVARVLDREAAAQPVEAAKALAVTIRSYLLQNAERRGECLAIRDSSASQRVAPRPASAAARAIAAWTADLVLAGSRVTYHSDLPGPERLAWQVAVEQANAGLRYDAILARAFPRASLSRWDKPLAACQALPAAEDWLHGQRRQWRTRLEGEPGYGEVAQFAVCRLQSGNPHVDRERRRIFVRGLFSLQDRLDLTHEYLHLAFEAHPNGQDETYIEGLARHLLLE
ncbi:DUF2300 domain-containing protein [Pseudomonas sp. L-22-4S-12]|uniref:DUF2300 domain-containing protein n=1 Tax=Pseudomonas sp. L-22-4S-12 TaxID=2610893 RepID=UPI00132BB31C|nr:DUF2300 domain-containing protein [Pseudomonas sp. L-22-4S-12]MWV15556.1 DUF2300 domain-containing protein [Pseudomonas sp. L-22-4S-12]